MKTITWTVEFNWDYDLDDYVEKITKYMKIYNLDLEQDSKQIKTQIASFIRDDIAQEDDDIYYNFCNSEFDTIINEVIKEIKSNYVQQIPLDI